MEKLKGKFIRLYEGDAEFLDEHFPRIGHTKVIRNLVRKFRKSIEEKLNQEGVQHDGNITITLDRSTEGFISGTVSERPTDPDEG